MKILLYRGRSWVSKLIQFQTRSKYSHVAVMLDDGTAVEAWHIGGVRRLSDPLGGDGHSPGTVIDVFGVYTPANFDADKVEEFLLDQVGKQYDFKSVFRFLTRRTVRTDDRWFCSELCLEAFEKGRYGLLSIIPSKASPRDVSISPLIYYDHSVAT